MSIDVLIKDDRWLDIPFAEVAHQALNAGLTHFGIDERTCDIALLACDDARIADLNREFRGKAVATNVLSWPAQTLAAQTDGAVPAIPKADIMGELALGDIAIAFDTCLHEAEAAGKSLPDHVTHLIIHGLLHLLGYDHERDGDAMLMEQTEIAILSTLGIDDPYSID